MLMNERIKELAEQAGLAYKMSNGKYWIDAGEPDIHLERFAELVEAAARKNEREECAKLCEDEYELRLAETIRAWGEK
jgi:hypothetical protein